jgi:hypothetical protein
LYFDIEKYGIIMMQETIDFSILHGNGFWNESTALKYGDVSRDRLAVDKFLCGQYFTHAVLAYTSSTQGESLHHLSHWLGSNDSPSEGVLARVPLLWKMNL